MRRGSRRLALLLRISTLTVVAACGGKGVVDGTHGAASSGDGGSGGGGGQASSSTGVETTICGTFCHAEAANGCEQDAQLCLIMCATELEEVGGCSAQLSGLLDCDSAKAMNTKVCANQLPCPDEANAFVSCVLPGANVETTVQQCSGDQTCQCHTDVNGIDYKSGCSGSNPVLCSCTRNAQLLGTCAAPSPDKLGTDLACDLFFGCCAPLFEKSN